MPLSMEVGLGPGHIVLDNDPPPLPPKGNSPQFLAHGYCGRTVAVSATAEHLLRQASEQTNRQTRINSL